jgi:bisphosphoglycerate-independent phosphoglycerate mutase (AlkP superfamily)
MSNEMKKAIEAMQEAVDKEMERKAKLGYKAVIADKHGRPKAVSAKYLVRKRRAELAAERSGNNGK